MGWDHLDWQTHPQRPRRSSPSFARLLNSNSFSPKNHVEPHGRAHSRYPFTQRLQDSLVARFLSAPITTVRGVGRPRVANATLFKITTTTTTTTTPPTTTTTSNNTPVKAFLAPRFRSRPVSTATLVTVNGLREQTPPGPPNYFVSMPASGSPATITTTNRSPSNAFSSQQQQSTSTTTSASASLKSLTKKFSAPQLYRSTSSGELNSSSNTPVPRVVKTPADSTDSEPTLTQDESSRASIFRRLSPGLAARVKLLNGSNEIASGVPGKPKGSGGGGGGGIGRIPEDHLRELDSQHRDLSIKIEKRGRIWGGTFLKRERSAPDLLESPTKTHATEEVEEKDLKKETPQKPAHKIDSFIQRFSQPNFPAEVATPVASSTMAAVEPAIGDSASRPHDVAESNDLQEYLKRSTQDEDSRPPPPPKDTPPAPSTPSSTNGQSSYFNPLGLNRTESIFSFSRASFSSQLSQLTSINLPQPASLESSISSIINAPTAVRALIGAAEQIQKWMNKASEVLNGMEAEDDVEWAAAGGREGLDDVDKAVATFESLVDVYVKAIENVQLRDDIDDVRNDDLTLIVSQMEATLKNWANIRRLLKGVKEQVELAMEWEELWNIVLGDVGLEIDNLSRLIFEMEEGRHKSLAADPETEQGNNGLDINELETIVEESPSHGTPASSTKRLSLALFPVPAAGADAARNSNPQDDANLMQLFARMQPLRASLDFLPMRLSMFQARAERLFPTACDELEDRRKRLETTYKKLEGDAEALRRELGEDRWILVFRNAGKQAQKMSESVERSIGKLQESLEANDPANNPLAITKKIESYEAKKIHYLPAIGRVMSIIQKGVNDRLTVNGEILTLLSDMKQRVDALKASMKVMDTLLEETSISRSQQLRDSISSVVTDSPTNTSLIGTPGSSPASSIIMTGNNNSTLRTPNPGGSSRRGSSVGSTSRSVTNSRRLSGIPTPSHQQRKSSGPLSFHSPTSSTLTPSPVPRMSRSSVTPVPNPNKPRWNASTNTTDLDTGHNFRSLGTTSPSPYGKSTYSANRNSRSVSSSLPIPSPLSRATSSSPGPGHMRTTSRVGSRAGFRPGSRLGATSPTSPSLKVRGSVLDPPPYSKLRKSTNRQSYSGQSSARPDDASKNERPGTALGHSNNRRISLLPQLRHSNNNNNNNNNKSGRESATGSRTSKLDERPRWR